MIQMHYYNQNTLQQFLTSRNSKPGNELANVGDSGVIDRAQNYKILSQMVAGLAEIHACGIQHRDLKPENVFLNRNEQN